MENQAEDFGHVYIASEKYILQQCPYDDCSNRGAYFTASAVKEGDETEYPYDVFFFSVRERFEEMQHDEIEDYSDYIDWTKATL